MNMRKYMIALAASLALFTGRANAQRCLPGMQGIEVKAAMTDGFRMGGNDGGHSFGALLSTYTKNGNKWSLGGEYLLKNSPYNDVKIPVAPKAATTSRCFPMPAKSCFSMPAFPLLPDMKR